MQKQLKLNTYSGCAIYLRLIEVFPFSVFNIKSETSNDVIIPVMSVMDRVYVFPVHRGTVTPYLFWQNSFHSETSEIQTHVFLLMGQIGWFCKKKIKKYY